MKILILTFSFPTFFYKHKNALLGGSFLLPEALSYVQAGARVTILTLHVPGLPLEEIINKNFKIVRVPYFFPLKWQRLKIPNYPLYTKKQIILRMFQFPFFITAYMAYLCKYVLRNDIVHANWTPTALLCLPFSFFFNRPIFLTFRGSDITLLPKFINKFIIKNVDGVFNWQLGNITSYIKYFKGNYVNLPFINDRKKAAENRVGGYPHGKTTSFTFIGRLTDDEIQLLKGLDIVIPAVSALKNKYKSDEKFHVHFLGDGPAITKLKAQQDEFKVQNCITFHGHQSDVFPFIAESNAVLGGIGINAVVQETAISERLLIMVDGEEWSGSIWKHMKNSLLYKPHNVDSLVEAMSFVIENPGICKSIAEKGNKTIQKFTTGIDNGGKIYLDFFETLIAKKQSACN